MQLIVKSVKFVITNVKDPRCDLNSLLVANEGPDHSDAYTDICQGVWSQERTYENLTDIYD